ncbi:MAG: sulfatase-like hydrolase/transferase [bacterium]|nr:hypothetical protein [Gammaproteobacteria bacterium]
MPDKKFPRSTSETLNGLHLSALFSFAVVQPIYDILARYPEFLIAHQLDSSDIYLIVLILSLGVPAAIVLGNLVVSFLFKNFSLLMQSCGVLVFSMLIALQVHKVTMDSNSVFAFSSSFALGLVSAVVYFKSNKARLFLTFLTPAIALFPLMFLFSPDIQGLLSKKSKVPIPQIDIKNPVPVIMIIFDELPLVSLLDKNGDIDEVRFPSFSLLASRSTWYRNATTSAESSLQAVPAILTGKYPDPERAPNADDYPESIFSFLGHTYEINAHETHTMLCPNLLCEYNATPRLDRLKVLFQDLKVLYQHLVIPSDSTRVLPPISRNWKDFVVAVQKSETETPGLGAVKAKALLSYLDRSKQFTKFIETIQPSPNPTFNFIHILLPHVPWHYYPSGEQYWAPGKIPGLITEKEWWGTAEWPITQAYRRHLLQTGLVDNLLGKLLDHLNRIDLYQSSMVVVVADHGVRFWPDESRRSVGHTHISDILNIPLFIKEPGQTTSQVSDRNMASIDLFPTIAELLKTKIPWKVNGNSVLQSTSTERTENLVLINNGKRTQRVPVGAMTNSESLNRKVDLFGSNSKLDSIFKIGPYGGLVGKKIAEFAPMGHTEFMLNLQYFSEPVSYVEGSISSKHLMYAPLYVVVADTGVITAVTQTYFSNSDSADFSILLPEPTSSSRLAFYVVRETPVRGYLELIPLEKREL